MELVAINERLEELVPYFTVEFAAVLVAHAILAVVIPAVELGVVIVICVAVELVVTFAFASARLPARSKLLTR